MSGNADGCWFWLWESLGFSKSQHRGLIITIRHTPGVCSYLVNGTKSSWSQNLDFLKFGFLQDPQQSLVWRLSTRRQRFNQLQRGNRSFAHCLTDCSSTNLRGHCFSRKYWFAANNISFNILMRSFKRDDSSYFSFLEQSTQGPLPLDVASAEQHENRQACDKSSQEPANNTSRNHRKARGTERREGSRCITKCICEFQQKAELWLPHLTQTKSAYP